MRIFPHANFGKTLYCPICGTRDDKPVTLVGIIGTEDGRNIETAQIHVDCVELYLIKNGSGAHALVMEYIPCRGDGTGLPAPSGILQEVARIQNYDMFQHTWWDFIEALDDVWRHDYGTMIASKPGSGTRELYLATGGWSENEDIILVLQANFILWSSIWEKSERGGAFWFSGQRWPANTQQ